MNRILNHAARIRSLADGGSGSRNALGLVTLSIDGIRREYVGDDAVWAWYRGSTGGPYPSVSALQAIERWIDRSVARGVSLDSLATDLLNGCENLAMPGLVIGAAIRHFGEDPRSLDRYLVEPSVWEFEQYRAAKEGISFLHPSDEGITNPERRSWQLADLMSLLVLNADGARQQELRDLGAELIENAAYSDVSESRLRRWAASFDANNIITKRVEGGVEVSVKEPEDIEQELAPLRADLERGNLLLSLQNKYWIPPRQQKGDWKPPTASDVARDLAQVRELHDDPPRHAGTEPHLALAHIAKEAIRLAVAESAEPFKDQIPYAIESILDILRQAAHDAENDPSARDHESDIGTRRAAAEALPWLFLPELATSLLAAGGNSTDVADDVAVLGSSAATETCLSFARGCDLVWSHACSGDPCIHRTAYDWVFDLARYCEASEFDEDLGEAVDAPLVGDVVSQLPQYPARPPRHVTPERNHPSGWARRGVQRLRGHCRS